MPAAAMSLSRLRLAVPSTPPIPAVPDVPALPTIPEMSAEAAERPVSAAADSPTPRPSAVERASPPGFRRVRVRD